TAEPEEKAAKPESQEEKEEEPAAKAKPTEAKEERRPPAVFPDGREAAAPAPVEGRKLVSPIAARMAAEAGINLSTLQGSGPGGRIIKRDIEEAIGSKPASATKPGAPSKLRAVPPLRPVEKGEAYAPSAY